MTTAAERRQHHQAMQQVHAEGWIAREDGMGREACPYFTGPGLELRHFWLAGWHDCDQKMDTRKAQ